MRNPLESAEVAFELLVELLCRHAIELCQIRVEDHAKTAGYKDLLLNLIGLFNVTFCDLKESDSSAVN